MQGPQQVEKRRNIGRKDGDDKKGPFFCPSSFSIRRRSPSGKGKPAVQFTPLLLSPPSLDRLRLFLPLLFLFVLFLSSPSKQREEKRLCLYPTLVFSICTCCYYYSSSSRNKERKLSDADERLRSSLFKVHHYFWRGGGGKERVDAAPKLGAFL